MSYPHNHGIVSESSEASPFNPPIDVILSCLSLLLTDPSYGALEIILMGEFEEVDDLRAEILINSNNFSNFALNHIFDEIDKAVDDYRRGVAHL